MITFTDAAYLQPIHNVWIILEKRLFATRDTKFGLLAVRVNPEQERRFRVVLYNLLHSQQQR